MMISTRVIQGVCRRGGLLTRVGRRCTVAQKTNKHGVTFGSQRTTGVLSDRRCMSSSSQGGSPEDEITGNDQLYLHVAPCGDWWVGTSLFAAKHLEPDYVKSISLPTDFDPDEVFTGEEHDEELLKRIYDEGVIPPEIIKSKK